MASNSAGGVFLPNDPPPSTNQVLTTPAITGGTISGTTITGGTVTSTGSTLTAPTITAPVISGAATLASGATLTTPTLLVTTALVTATGATGTDAATMPTVTPAAVIVTGATGSGAAVNGQINATWTDATGDSLGLSGPASQGTRTTDPTFVLSWTMLIDNQPVTFTSRASECTIGMAVGVKVVHGTFVCKQLKSGDGKHEIDMRGTYTT